MEITIRGYSETDAEQTIAVWNEVVECGDSFPQIDPLGLEDGNRFFKEQSYTAVAVDERENIVGLYILHPNNIGRCGHICNASYAVSSSCRGKGIGEALVKHCIKKGKELGFRILQFNAVVKTNERAVRLYKKLEFVSLGVIPKGFLMKNGEYEDIIPFYRSL